ncbi:MAG TPA: SUMF1/EgtB/PvdO family nonheme iron enzyme [Polyangiaceae bacterium]|nr:SUMF1/EgtB/PvdO family nonheme iron enzyme [Polyangiaceae bacterium]
MKSPVWLPLALRVLLALLLGAFIIEVARGGTRATRSTKQTVGAPASATRLSVASAPVALLVTAPLPAVAADLVSADCPPEMVLVAGDYCTRVEQRCQRWLDDEKLPFARCAEYERPSRCIGHRISLRVCIDRYEYTQPAERLPRGDASFVIASQTCTAIGKRVCTESEWNFACEGEEMRPYPYGFARAPVCNQDRSALYEPGLRKQILKDWRQPSGSLSECTSPFGVYDLAGNLDEPVLRDAPPSVYPFRNALKGGWWMAARNRCRPATTAHDDHYSGVQIGIRCCKAAGPAG